MNTNNIIYYIIFKYSGDDLFIAPIAVPKLPARKYFIFQETYDTKELNVYNKKQCREAYTIIRNRVEDGLDYLQNFRLYDPYKDFIPRTLYEMISQTQAPTAPLI